MNSKLGEKNRGLRHNMALHYSSDLQRYKPVKDFDFISTVQFNAKPNAAKCLWKYDHILFFKEHFMKWI